MAFCTKCGAKLEDGALFCTSCGTKVEAAVEEVKETATETVEEVVEEVKETATETVEEVKEEVKETAAAVEEKVEEVKAEAPTANTANTTNNAQTISSTSTGVDVSELKEKIKNIPKFVWGIVAAAIVAIIAISIVVSNIKHTLNINDYLDVQFTGYDTIGKCEADWSEDFWEAFYDKAGKVPASSSYDTMMKKLKYEVTPTEGLSNGDTVEVKWKVDTKYFKKHYGLNIKCDDKKHKVDGLEEVDTFDPFDGIEITYSGVEGQGRAAFTVTSDDPIYSDLDFYIDNSYNLKTGDTITVELQMRGVYGEDEIIDKCAEKYGEVPSAFEKKVKVEGLGRYVTKASELNDKNLAPLRRTADDALTQETTSWDETASLGGTKFLGTYVLTEKNHGDNMVFLVYEVTVNFNYEGQSDSCTYYTYVKFRDVTINDKGELGCDTSNFSKNYNSFRYESSIKESKYWTNTYYLDGFEKISALNDDIVTGNLARYDSDTNVSMSEGSSDDTSAEDAAAEEDSDN